MPKFKHRVVNAVLRAVIGLSLALPYRMRVPLFGWVVSRVVAPVAGWTRRVRDNLALVWPELPKSEVKRLMREVPDNVGRTIIEIYSGKEFIERTAAVPPVGAGVAALDAARDAGRPVILVTGHFGNYDASRAAMGARGIQVGALYMPMVNKLFNAHYEEAIGNISRPLFPRSPRGLGQMVRFLRGGGVLGMLVDHHMSHGITLGFFGHEAKTALSAAEMALKYDALLIPTYGIRQPDGLNFQIVVEAPIPHTTPEVMTQALNDSLEALVRQHPEQWFWIHRRWKGAGAPLIGEDL
ncbi:lysophospholipid acyltransferase family protein [Falsigemmobacter faecalis]|uniref:Lauroyl acyltransferase n=1 Tax=Falsigemmobacter faecalis TaxID=2488730 RepID=A0A3P3DHU0_9RHOB|nr:lauroyl acyltransferase [Falsigemmobacter faecalis]RRH73829.1 lauroyl acyltransferase [Falsigemmobacter faecalis]